MSISPLVMFPKPPTIMELSKGQILTVFLNRLANSKMGWPSASYMVAVQGCCPESTMNCEPLPVQATS